MLQARSDWVGALTNFQKVLTSLGEERDASARERLLQARPASSSTRARPSRPSTTSRRRSALEPAHRPTLEAMVAVYDGAQGLEAGLQLQAADPRQRHRRSTERFKMLQEIGERLEDREKNPPRASRRSRRRSSSSRRTTSYCTSCLGLYQDHRELVEDDRHDPATHRGAGDAARCARAGTSTRWRSSIATSWTTRAAPSSSSTRRSISTRRSSRRSSASTRS